MKVLHKKRPIGWLIDKAMLAISDPFGYRIVCYIHEYKLTPNDIYAVYNNNDSKDFAKSARFLAIIYRDYGQAVFQQVIDLVKTVNVSQSEDVRHA